LALTKEIIIMIDYKKIGIDQPPLEKKIIVKKDVGSYEFDDKAKIVTLYGDSATIEWHCMTLVCEGFTLWAEV
tara:strand:+ start:5628 stop:5846 length:219 start_codon:yes stop_codon:yes gene_type:complete